MILGLDAELGRVLNIQKYVLSLSSQRRRYVHHIFAPRRCIAIRFSLF